MKELLEIATARPWHHKLIARNGGNSSLIAHDQGDDSDLIIGEASTPANAELTCKAVNEYEALCRVAEMLERILKDFVTPEAFPNFSDKGCNDRFIELATSETAARSTLATLNNVRKGN